MKVTLLILTLDEIQGVREIMPQLNSEWCDQLIVVDGGSKDGTLEYLQEKGYSVILQKQPGPREAYLDALEHVDGDIIITFSPDGNSVPEIIPQLVSKMKEGYDLAIVSRYLDGAKSYDDSFISGLANKIFTLTINVLFGGHYTDALVIYRAYKKELIGLLELDQESSYHLPEALFRKPMSWEMLLSIRCAKRRLKVAEIPGDEPCRIGGRRGLHWRWGFAYLLQMIREVFVWR